MLRIKLASLLVPLALGCSISAAQELTTDCQAKPPVPLKDEAYGPYIAYTGSILGVPPQKCSVAPVPPAAGDTPNLQIASNLSPQQMPLMMKTEPQKDGAAVPDVPHPAPSATTTTPKCEPPPTPRKDEVYGSFVPYTGPLLGLAPPTCKTGEVLPAADGQPNLQTEFSNTPLLNLPATPERPPDSSAKSAAPYQPAPAPMTTGEPAVAPSPTPGEPASISEYVRAVPPPRAATIPQEITPFRSLAIGFKADTLGLGIEFATPMAYRLNLRSSINFFAFTDPFNIDGVDYDARLHLKSSETTVDWFPHGEGGFHISPGILYLKNTMSAPASVGPGQSFVLGTQTFINSVDDPMSGTSSVVYPHSFAPLLLLGYGNIIPRVRRHFTIPIEFGVAYTGAPTISVALSGTACTTEGCVSFAANKDAQTFLKQEVHNLNEDLKRYPVFPILSIGMAYHF